MTGRWIALTMLLAAAPAPDTVVVKREGSRVMKGPRFFGEPCTVSVSPGQALRLLERRGGWGRLSSPGDGRCWLHESSWVDRKPGELVGDPAVASQRDIELAGRGFSEAEEARFRAEHPDLAPDFAVVELYLKSAPETGSKEIAAFCAAGGLGGGR
jgi:hypothetical protein